MARKAESNADTARRYWQTASDASGWFGNLPPDKRKAVLAVLQFRHIEPGQTLYAQGDEASGLFGIASGTIHTIGLSEDGHPTLLSVLRAGEWTGFLGLMDGKPAPFMTVAVSPVSFAFLPAIDAHAIFGTDKDSLSLLAAPLVQILRFAFNYLTETNNRSPSRMIAQRILDLSRCIYMEGSAPGSVIDRVNQDDVAAATYLARPTVNRVLKSMAEKGMIEAGYGHIKILDVAALDATAKGMSGTHDPSRRIEGPSCTAAPFREAGRIGPEERERLLTFGWLPTLPKDVRGEILSSVLATRCARGERLYAQGQQSLGLYAVTSGNCQTTSVALDGRPFLFSLLHPGYWTGFVPLLDGGPQPFSVTASTPLRAVLLPAKPLGAIFFSSAERYRLLLSPVFGMLRAIYDFLINGNRGSPRRLVAQRLGDFVRLPYLEGDRPRALSIGLTQHDLAAATGLSRLTINRVTAELETLGAISRGYRQIVISDPARLAQLALCSSD